MISNSLFTNFCPDPELLIRTSGESRISNFLLGNLHIANFILQTCIGQILEIDLFRPFCFQQRDRRFQALIVLIRSLSGFSVAILLVSMFYSMQLFGFVWWILTLGALKLTKWINL